MPPPRLLVLGHAAHDLVYRVPVIPSRPVKVVASGLTECGGGMAANAAVAIARLGGKATYWGRVADDALGARILAELAAEGVDVADARRVPGCRSPISSILIDERGDRLICSYSDPALDTDPGWLPLDRVAGYDAVLADVRWPQGSEALLAAARAAGRPALLDADVATADVLDALSAAATHVLYSEVGLSEARPGRDAGGALRDARRPWHSLVGVTLGENGFLWIDASGEHHAPAPKVDAVDTLAAGDVWHGAFALAVAEGRPFAAAAEFANAAAALKCLRPGGRSGAPTRAELIAWLAR
ncbi:MAG: PfkB family carbohydrate kinase [Betaproteobacteria bacterium]|jgi:sulfofructose kinase|nr:PfkB family carbohydrate kinase [Betaproteobacteria bacterium]